MRSSRTARQRATILDDDGQPNLSIGNATVTEGGNDVVHGVVVEDEHECGAVHLRHRRWHRGGRADYSSTSNNRTIAAGNTSTTITVATTEDALDEADETFRVLLSNVSQRRPDGR